jgi:hypothetical protein
MDRRRNSHWLHRPGLRYGASTILLSEIDKRKSFCLLLNENFNFALVVADGRHKQSPFRRTAHRMPFVVCQQSSGPRPGPPTNANTKNRTKLRPLLGPDGHLMRQPRVRAKSPASVAGVSSPTRLACFSKSRVHKESGSVLLIGLGVRSEMNLIKMSRWAPLQIRAIRRSLPERGRHAATKHPR